MKKLLFPPILLFVFLASYSIFSQNIELSALTIPDSLTINANACIRRSTVNVTLKSIDEIIIHKKRIVTIFNKLGDVHSDIYQGYDDDTKITKLSAKIYDSLGNEIKKFSKNKFTDVSAVDGASLYSDSRVKYIDYTPTTYPYTIVFESETKSSSTGFIPSWMPLENYFISTIESNYILKNPNKFEIRTKKKNIGNFAIKKHLESNIVNYSAKNLKAIKAEQRSPGYFDILPTLFFASNTFTLKKIKGSGKNWQEFGKWYYNKLLSNRIELPESTKNKIKDLTKNATSNIEKAKLVYDFVQKNTRYISVQVGIGGWQPISASEVDKLGYGDCKGLTNYTKSLLDAVGVTSYYTVVWAKSRRNISRDFSSIEGNHIILNIPNNKKDIWLECTSQIAPFGFLGSFTEDRDVLVITPTGGVIKHTPSYENEYNYQSVNSKIILKKDGSVTADFVRTSKGIQYDDKYYTENKTKEDLIKHYKTRVWSYLNNLEINNITTENNKEKVVFTEKGNVFIKDYAYTTDDELILRLNAFNRFNSVPKRYRKRTLPFKITYGFLDEDESVFSIPEGYTIQELPKQKEISSSFGIYRVSVEKINDQKIKYKKKFLLKKGVYPKEEYKNYRDFIKKITRYENLKIALIKK